MSASPFIKPLHGVGQPPFAGVDFSRIARWLTPAGIPFSRLHDVGGCFGNNLFVDIPNIFRDFDADPADPASYDFTFTDLLMKALTDAGVEPFFRLGVTIENYARFKAYRIHPPKDFSKWADICAGVVRHYNEGWADGFHYNIRYWEIWNEPENHVDPKLNEMWTGTAEQYYALYDVTAKRLKEEFPDIRVGGYASCGFYALKNPGDPLPTPASTRPRPSPGTQERSWTRPDSPPARPPATSGIRPIPSGVPSVTRPSSAPGCSGCRTSPWTPPCSTTPASVSPSTAASSIP